MKAIDVMVKDVVTATPDMTVADAVKLLVGHDVSALPVVDGDGRLVGILSEADLLHREELGTEKQRSRWIEAILPAHVLAHEFTAAHGKKVSELMTEAVVTAAEDTPIGDIAALMERHRIKRVPIVRDGRIVGIVSRSNLVQALASQSSAAAPSDDDRTIRLDILERLKQQQWTDFGERNIIVRDGEVHIWGLVGSEDERKALVVLAENTPGVRSVVDETLQ